jgi:Co/Zn/Cd efflux system component
MVHNHDHHGHSNDHHGHSHDHHEHSHDHGHSHKKSSSCSKTVRLTTMLIMIFVYFIVEIIIGHITHSLTLIADSFHMLSDFIALLIALISVWVNL